VVTLELTASGRGLVAAAAAWRRQELARILGRLAPQDQAAITAALGRLVGAAGDDYRITDARPVPRRDPPVRARCGTPSLQPTAATR
jgi:hypothetical protein